MKPDEKSIRQDVYMSMQSFLKKASQKLVQDPDAEPAAEGDTHQSQQPQASKSKHASSNAGSGKTNAPAQVKKGTRKKV